MTHMPGQPMTCDQLDLLLPDHLDGTLDAATRAAVDAHLAICEACRSTAEDLAAIVAGARALPALQPGRDLWQGIAARIETPVVAIETARDARAARALRAVPRWWRTGAAAAVLVAATAGITHQATIHATRDSAATGSGTTVAAQPVDTSAATGGALAAGPAVDSPAPDSGARVVPSVVAPRREAATLASGPAARRETRTPALAPLPAGAAVYDHEIAAMRSVLRERRGQLDTATVRVLERNLQLIDQAITESRAALARDPGSGLLTEQLTRAMRRKLELLRIAAALPDRAT